MPLPVDLEEPGAERADARVDLPLPEIAERTVERAG